MQTQPASPAAPVTLTRLDGGAWTPTAAELESLRRQLRGELCLPGSAGHEEARTIWNAMIDRRPGAVIRAATAEDVRRAVELAARHRLLLAVRGGGHHIAGNAVCEGGLLLDLSPMKAVRVDPPSRTARVEPGVTLAGFDRVAQASGLATPLGINSTTGVAGLTLGGGFGWISRKHGLTIDNLLSAEVVLASGALVRASARENQDLFWALRGGGGNFGVVTSFEFQLHPIGPEVLAGLIVHPLARAGEVLRGWRSAMRAAPEELACWAVMRKAPPLPFLPPEVHGREVLVLAACWVGDPAAGPAALAPLRALGTPVADAIGPAPFAAWQQAFDPLLTPGRRNYWKSHDFVDLGDAALDLLAGAAATLPSPECEIFLAHLGGAVNRVAADATAYPHRDVDFVVNVHARWGEPSQDQACIGWARALFDRLAPHATGGVYVNFMPEDEAQRVGGGAYRANFARLARLKAKFDPENLFRQNQNIQPAPAGRDA